MCFQACPHFCVWKWWVSLTHIINVPVWVPRAVKRHTKGPDRTVSLLAVTSGSSNRQSDVSEAEITVARWAQSVSTNLLAFLCDHRKQRWSWGRRTAAASSKLLTSHWLEGTMKFYFSSNFMDVTETGSLKLRTGFSDSLWHTDMIYHRDWTRQKPPDHSDSSISALLESNRSSGSCWGTRSFTLIHQELHSVKEGASS